VGQFELLERDGLARLGRLETPHGPIETPALLPVVHPDPTRQPVAPKELRRRFGLRAVITSAYITARTPALAAVAEEKGIHGLLDFDGPVMTDSGAFQQHAYGHVDVTPEQILAFQRRIGSDITTVLDIFVEPQVSEAEAEAGVDETIRRARAARELTRGLLAVPVQGGSYPGLRQKSAAAASEIGDVLAVGGVVPLLEQYRFPELARALIAARPALAPEGVVHLFGTGHPISFAFAALFGVDLFDSASYLKFARRGALLFPEGTLEIGSIREPICGCVLCASRPLTEVAKLEAGPREQAIAEHNLLQCALEIARVRQSIRDGALWELAERRAAAHPALQAGLRSAVRGVRIFLPTEPESRPGFRAVGATSSLRPSVIRFLAHLQMFRSGKGPYHGLLPRTLTPGALRGVPTEERGGRALFWEVPTPIGPVPLELAEIYPVGCYLGVEEFEELGWARRDREMAPETEGLDVDLSKDWADAWAWRHASAILEWAYGTDGARALGEHPLTPRRSPRTGRLRGLQTTEGQPAFFVGNDGIPRPTFLGGEILRKARPYPRGRIVVAPDAIPFVSEGRSLFSKFVGGGDPSLVPGQSALLVDGEDRLLGIGRLLLAPPEMGRLRRGVAVWVTAHARSPNPELPDDAPPPPPDAPSTDGL
jgi:7-cyano-7-deazaguanine tRNA-ribosyltransferase